MIEASFIQTRKRIQNHATQILVKVDIVGVESCAHVGLGSVCYLTQLRVQALVIWAERLFLF